MFDERDVAQPQPVRTIHPRYLSPSYEPRRLKRPMPWRKLLWVRQDQYPDNWVDSTFLEDLKRNGKGASRGSPRLTGPVNVQAYDLWPLVADEMPIVQHFCSIIMFACCFVALNLDMIRPEPFAIWSSVLTSGAFVFWDKTLPESERELPTEKRR